MADLKNEIDQETIEKLESLHSFLTRSFRGATVGNLSIDDIAEALARVIKIAKCD